MRHLNSRAAIAGIGELKPKRRTKGRQYPGFTAEGIGGGREGCGAGTVRYRRPAGWPTSGRDATACAGNGRRVFWHAANHVERGRPGWGVGPRHGLARGGRHRGRDVRNRALRSGESPQSRAAALTQPQPYPRVRRAFRCIRSERLVCAADAGTYGEARLHARRLCRNRRGVAGECTTQPDGDLPWPTRRCRRCPVLSGHCLAPASA